MISLEFAAPQTHEPARKLYLTVQSIQFQSSNSNKLADVFRFVRHTSAHQLDFSNWIIFVIGQYNMHCIVFLVDAKRFVVVPDKWIKRNTKKIPREGLVSEKPYIVFFSKNNDDEADFGMKLTMKMTPSRFDFQHGTYKGTVYYVCGKSSFILSIKAKINQIS